MSNFVVSLWHYPNAGVLEPKVVLPKAGVLAPKAGVVDPNVGVVEPNPPSVPPKGFDDAGVAPKPIWVEAGVLPNGEDPNAGAAGATPVFPFTPACAW
jgi:hypothetical protein